MTLSTSRQQFLAYDTQPAEDIGYGRRGGLFLTSCVCAGLVVCAVVLAALVGVIVYYVTSHKLSQNPTDFWDDEGLFGKSGPPSPDLRLPSTVEPSFYRIKLLADLEHSIFSGDVYITIRASKKTKEIILHAKNLGISSDAKLTEQIYEKVETLHTKRKREVEINTPQNDGNNSLTANTSVVPNVESASNNNNTTDTTTPVSDSKAPAVTTQIVPEATSNQSQAPSDLATNVTAPRHIEALNPNMSTARIDLSHPADITTTPKLSIADVNFWTPNTTSTDVKTTTLRTNLSISDIHFWNPDISRRSDSSTQVTHSSVRNIKILSVEQASGDRLILTLATALKPNVDYTLELSFEGKISNSMTGFYKSSYVNSKQEEKQVGVTQFEPTSARAAFPCFDEPAFKATFEISIAHQSHLSVLSNMKVASQEPHHEKSDWKWTHFDRSVKMSTYLVAYIISDFKSIETSYKSKDNVTKPIRVWTRPELISKGQYALSITPKLLEYYEEVFGVPYALDKIDLVAIPDFSSGAMENWGLMTFRETTLLFDEAESVPRDKQAVAVDVAHELAHQWFGNLVTMRWWTDLWLNEGFATYIEYVGVDHIEPEWNMFESFSRDKMDLLRSDALKSTSPVSLKVIDASEISQKFDEISYTKGSNLIRMLNHTISKDLFHKGLLYYLDHWKYTNAEENDLWEAMTTATRADPVLKERSLVEFMNSWTRQAGYPVVKVRRNYETGDVTFDQRLFSSSRVPYPAMAEQLWQIPVSFTATDSPLSSWSTAPRLWLTQRSHTQRLPFNDTQPLYVNVGAIGYYRVNYDARNWELLTKALKSGHIKSSITRAQLIDDAFNLAKASQLNYSQALNLTTYVIDGEDSKIVWDLLLNNMGFLKHTLKTLPGYVHFQDFMKILLKKQLERLNYGLNKPKDDNEAFLIENLVMWECNVGSDRCLKWAREQFDQWSEKRDWRNNSIPSYLRPLVYSVALRYGGRREFDSLWRVFTNSSDPGVRSLAINSLPATREEALIAMLLEKSVSELPKQYAVSVWSVEPPLGPAVAQAFLIDNFDRVYNRFTEMDAFTFPAVLNGAFGFINTQQELDRLKRFAMEHKEKLMPMSQTLRKLVDTATMRIEWIRNHADHIVQWLAHFVADHSGVATSASAPKSASQPPAETLTTLNDTTKTSANGSTVSDMLADAPVPNSPAAVSDPNDKASVVNDATTKSAVVNDPTTKSAVVNDPTSKSAVVKDSTTKSAVDQNVTANPVVQNDTIQNPELLNAPTNSTNGSNPAQEAVENSPNVTPASIKKDSNATVAVSNDANKLDAATSIAPSNQTESSSTVENTTTTVSNASPSSK